MTSINSRRSNIRTSRTGQIAVKLVLLIVLLIAVGGAIALVPYLLRPPAEEPAQQPAQQAAEDSVIKPIPLKDMDDLDNLILPDESDNADADASPDASSAGDPPDDAAVESETAEALVESEAVKPAEESETAESSESAPDSQLPLPELPPLPLVPPDAETADAPDAADALDASAADADQQATEADGELTEQAIEALASGLPRLQEIDEQALKTPRQSPLLLPALRQYKLDLSKGQLLLDDVRDGTMEFDEAPLYWVLNVCRKLPRAMFIPEDGEAEVPFARLWQAPDIYRGWPVTISGLVGNVEKWELPHPEIINIERVWLINIHKPMKPGQQFGDVCTLFVTDDPGNLNEGTAIRARGFFFKIRKYELEQRVDRNTSQIWKYTCPVVVGKTIIIDVPPAAAVEKTSALGPIAVVALIVFLLIVLFFIRKVVVARSRTSIELVRMTHGELNEDERRQRLEFLEQVGRQPPDNPSS